MLTVFQLLLSLVTRQNEDDPHGDTNEPVQDDQLEQTRNQSENAEDNAPDSLKQGILELGVDEAMEAPPPEVVDQEPIAVATVNGEADVSESQVDPEQADIVATGVPSAESATGDVPVEERNDTVEDSQPASEVEESAAADSAGEEVDAPETVATNAHGAVESRDEMTSPTDVITDSAPETTSQEPETINPAAPEPSQDAESIATVPSEAASEKARPVAAAETSVGVDVDEKTPPVSDELPPSNDAAPRQSEVSETASPASETDLPTEAQASVETEAIPSDQPEAAALEREAVRVKIEAPIAFGAIDEVFNFTDAFGDSQTNDTEQVVATSHHSAGGARKPAIVQKPRRAGGARLERRFSLPQIASDATLILHFSTGLQDDVDSDAPRAKPRDVQFAIEISGERYFEEVSTECKWNEHAIDISRHAGKEIRATLITACAEKWDADNNAPLWGNPRILKLTRTSPAVEKEKTEPTAAKGLVIGSFKDIKRTGEGNSSVGKPADESNGKISVTEFAYESPTPVSKIADEISQRMIAEFQTRESSINLSPQEFGAAVYTELPELELATLGLNAAVVTVSEDFEVQCVLRNSGTVALSPENKASVAINRVKLRRGRNAYPVKILEAGDETKLVWNLRRFSRETTAQISVLLKYQTPVGEVRQTLETVIEIQPASPKLSSQVVPELQTHNVQEHVLIENKHARLLFVQGARGFEYFLLFAAKQGSYRHVATNRAISEIRYRNSKGKTRQLRILPTIYRLAGNSLGESTVILVAEQQDDDAVKWSFEARFSLNESGKRVRTEYRLSASARREILAFNGPMLHAGDCSFGESKTAALFPGLEFLGTDEPSSNTRDAAPPFNNRLVPHPSKITVPVMAVEHKKMLVGLAWNPLQTWDGKHMMPSAVFASPNWHEKRQNHLMGLFLPAPGSWVKENCLEAATPYTLEANRQLTMSANIIIDGNASISDAIAHWTDLYGMPKPVQSPRDDEEELTLSRHGFMRAAKAGNTGKSQQVVESAPANVTGIATLLWYDYLATRDDGAKQRALAIARNAMRESRTGEANATVSRQTLNWELPFYFGGIEASLERIDELVRELIKTQEDDGRWRCRAVSDNAEMLGKGGDKVLGVCANFAFILLKHARVSGDESSLNAGLRALKGMDRFKIPRGAQASECPLKTPALLAAAYAVGACVEAYAITEDKRHIERAEFWAKAGLPFIYHWNLPDRAAMRFASVPAFGAASRTRPWFGVPSQWSGLVYAYHLQRLARYNSKCDWGKIAEGITVSGMRQQWTEGKFKGAYPHGLYEFCTKGRAPHLSPENIMANLYTLRGQDPDISTEIIRHENRRIHLSSGAQIETGSRGGNGKLNFKLSYVDNETSHTIITGYGSIPSAVRARNQDLPCVEDLEAAESGWLYRQEKDTIFVKCKHAESEITFEVLPPKEETPETVENPRERPADAAASVRNAQDEAPAETPESTE